MRLVSSRKPFQMTDQPITDHQFEIEQTLLEDLRESASLWYDHVLPDYFAYIVNVSVRLTPTSVTCDVCGESLHAPPMYFIRVKLRGLPVHRFSPGLATRRQAGEAIRPLLDTVVYTCFDREVCRDHMRQQLFQLAVRGVDSP